MKEPLPIAFPTLLTGIILDQQPGILSAADVTKKRESPLTLHFKLFESRHVADLVGASAPTSAPTAASTDTGLMSKKEIVAALKDTCRYLEERKALFERMILALENEEAGEVNEAVDAGMEDMNDGDAVAAEEEEDGDEEEDMETDA
ncbi:hypothetical protein P8452_49812 [Trifolium repens]|nr:hypothetical protein P8452_49812 [Trifolium repens]